MQVGETYDWRLSIANMERRDGYFTRLKLRVEMLHQLNKEKVENGAVLTPSIITAYGIHASTLCSRVTNGVQCWGRLRAFLRVADVHTHTHTHTLPVQVMLTSHSWGEAVVRNFFWWVERREKGWTEKHVAAYVNIAGTVLGVPKVMSSRHLLPSNFFSNCDLAGRRSA